MIFVKSHVNIELYLFIPLTKQSKSRHEICLRCAPFLVVWGPFLVLSAGTLGSQQNPIFWEFRGVLSPLWTKLKLPHHFLWQNGAYERNFLGWWTLIPLTSSYICICVYTHCGLHNELMAAERVIREIFGFGYLFHFFLIRLRF